jgi:hypothetical protein
MGIREFFGGTSHPTFNGTPIGDPINRTQEEINARMADGINGRCEYVSPRGKQCKDPRESGNSRCTKHIRYP